MASNTFPRVFGLYTRFDVARGLAVLEKALLSKIIIALGVEGIREICQSKKKSAVQSFENL